MSLVGTWVEALDGNVYENPVLEGEGWFVCFDDDDPPELVVTEKLARVLTPERILKNAGIKASDVRFHGGGQRQFKRKFRHAQAYFFKLDAPVPVPQKFSNVAASLPKGGEYCFITFKTVRP